jgi:hypothetical protein
MKRNVIFNIPVLYIVSLPSLRVVMVNSATRDLDTRNYAVFSFIDKQKTGTDAIYPYV